ncbi:AAA family ATPase [Leptospira bandrabouensis]|uniref:AAA family ATPase n=1 Tax=Leptospira bandrabouensis TaxID=2484903 RepID=UPI00223DBF4F|nr:AAA family ATPase [Leptospira bandrabouensis]MCW7458564.1 AAA family ATPase [Leptospira bandrabouensis]MCW7478689.1 AAA family ATPase [Leptospira bandrabouensis]MCW7486647.1 AAA family ATPase [Leptospira bandrabouensis]
MFFASLENIVSHFRQLLTDKKYILIYAYNGTGKTRLSMAFKDAGKDEEERDTLYFNAFTEDLFRWDNDLDNDNERKLLINRDSRFVEGIQSLEMESRIRPLLRRYADFDFFINYEDWSISFERKIRIGDGTVTFNNIKVSRGEEIVFIWCFFLAIAELAIDEEETYRWVKYIYIDDPISSLDDNNAISVAGHLAQMLKKQNNRKKIIISSHHTLFFNVLCNELRNAERFFLSKNDALSGYNLHDTTDTPFYHHVATLKDLTEVARSGQLYTYHFNVLRNILEKTAHFHGFKNFSQCIKQDNDDPDGVIYTRMINVLSHGNYSLFEPKEMLDENKEYFRKILYDFLNRYQFNPEFIAR